MNGKSSHSFFSFQKKLFHLFHPASLHFFKILSYFFNSVSISSWAMRILLSKGFILIPSKRQGKKEGGRILKEEK